MHGFGPAAPKRERGVVNAFRRVATSMPRGSLMCNGGSSNNHGDRNGVAVHCVNNNREGIVEVISFGEGGSNIPTIMGAVRCSPGHSTHVTLLCCTSNRGECVVTPGKLRINTALVSNRGTTPRVNGTLPLRGVPINAMVRGVRLHPKRNTTLIHSTNGFTRLASERNGCYIVGLPSNRIERVLDAYGTAINDMNGSSRKLRDSNGTKHSH